MKIGIFASGSGSNALNIIQHAKTNQDFEVACILTNNSQAGVIQHALNENVPYITFSKTEFTQSSLVIDFLRKNEVEVVVLAGFLWLVPSYLIESFPNRILNIHPALLPKHGGKGMYGHFVHEAVVQDQDQESGITIHLVNEHYDEGAIVFQKSESVIGLNAQEVEQVVRRLEIEYYPQVISNFIQTLEK
jgi:phosphoribosylglycinamide formyltransferase-1